MAQVMAEQKEQWKGYKRGPFESEKLWEKKEMVVRLVEVLVAELAAEWWAMGILGPLDLLKAMVWVEAMVGE